MASRATTALLVLGLVPGIARAQSDTPAPDPGPPPSALLRNGGKTTMLTVLSTYGGYDQSRVDAGADSITRDGQYGGAGGSLTWSRPLSRFTASAAGSGDVRYYARAGGLSDVTVTTAAASVALAGPIGQRTSLRLAQSGASDSFFQFDPFGRFGFRSLDDLELPSSDSRVERARTYTFTTDAALESRVGRFSTLTATYGMRHVNFPGELLTFQLHSQGVRFLRQIRPSIYFNAGYGYDFGATESYEGTGYHRVDLGVSYEAPLTFSRRTTVAFSTGTALVATKLPDESRTRQVPLVIANASIRHAFNPRWTASAEYRRTPHVVELYRNTTYADAAYLSLQGRIARRMRVGIAGGATRATLNAGRGDLASQSIYGTGRFSIEATRTLSTYVEYAYYDFQLGSAPSLIGPLRHVGRHAVRAGLSLRMPLLRPLAP